MSFLTVAAATLPSVPLDFKGNRDRILESLRVAKQKGATVRTGPELEIPGYGCLDHHLEGDTFAHSWEVLAEIISDPVCKGMLVDLGMGCRHRSVSLEEVIERVTGQRTVLIGDAILSTRDTAIGCETCEELFTPLNPSTYMSLNGCEIILNSSASHAELRKLKTRLDLIANSTRKAGGCYVYANATGVDGMNGKPIEQGQQFSLEPVEVITATIDLEEIRSFRSSISRNVQAAQQADYTRVEWDIRLSRSADEIFLSKNLQFSTEKELHVLDPMDPAGLDSATVSLFVYGMAKLVLSSIAAGSKTTLADLRRVTGIETLVPETPEQIVGLLLTTCYSSTVNSSDETRSRAEKLAERLGAQHFSVPIDQVIQANLAIIDEALHFKPKYMVEGGTRSENLALQNIQARARLTTQYMLAQLATTATKSARAGSALLVLTSGNVDENLRGYYTKYDASSGDLAPLGSISKEDAKRFQRWAMKTWSLPILEEFINATPTAELLPLSAGVQDDESESEMGLTYKELSVFGECRSVEKLGPWSCYLRLLGRWKDRNLTAQQIAEKVMRFFRYATTITPSLHLSAYNPDDNRHDLRPFLYVVDWPFQFDKIRAHAEHLGNMKSGSGEGTEAAALGVD
ncbi:NAD+ synthase [Xylaria palmicola]|nr:NAD+ synthase [Xylaria palmicola]